MRVCSLLSSRVGHTHNRLDAIYGLISHSVRYIEQMSDLEDVKANLVTVIIKNFGYGSALLSLLCQPLNPLVKP